MRILVADDDVLTRRILEKILGKAGHEVVAAASGAEAWQILSWPDRPALAILDWMMPQMTGVEVCRRVREVGGAQPTYLVVLTSRGQTCLARSFARRCQRRASQARAGRSLTIPPHGSASGWLRTCEVDRT